MTGVLRSHPETRPGYEVLGGALATGPLFVGWDWDKFSREVWVPAKRAMAARHTVGLDASNGERKEADALGSALERLRLHDLRHAACSMWLNTPGMELRRNSQDLWMRFLGAASFRTSTSGFTSSGLL